MDTDKEIIGRTQEQKAMQRLIDNPRSEFLAVYGRRRVGKNFIENKQFSTALGLTRVRYKVSLMYSTNRY